MAKKWVKKFKEGRDKLHDEPRSGWPCEVTGGRILRGWDTETGAPL